MIKVVGAEKLLATLAAKDVAGIVASQAGKDATGMEVLRSAQDAVPVLTGFLHDHIFYEAGPDVSRVYTEVVYASQVEYGGLHNPPEPYMRPAADLLDAEVVSGVMKEIFDSA